MPWSGCSEPEAVAVDSDRVDSDTAGWDMADCIADADCRARRSNILRGVGLRDAGADDVRQKFP